jgi:hypothetical protein
MTRMSPWENMRQALDAARGTTKLESVSLWARMKYVNELQSAKQGRIELRRQVGVRAAAWVSKRLCRKRS